MENAINQLKTADAALGRISVRGDDVYALVQARAALKLAYDALTEEGGDTDAS